MFAELQSFVQSFNPLFLLNSPLVLQNLFPDRWFLSKLSKTRSCKLRVHKKPMLCVSGRNRIQIRKCVIQMKLWFQSFGL